MKKLTFGKANEIMKEGFLNSEYTYEEINDAEQSFGIERYSDCLCDRCARMEMCFCGSEERSNWVDETLHNAIIKCNYFKEK